LERGKFITLEGMDGAGKSTHLTWLTQFLQGRGREVVVTREPGGTSLGEELRKLLLSQPMQPETEALLMFAARAEHVQTVIKPSLAKGSWVISDRFADASFAYQGGGRGVAEAKLSELERWVQNGLQPDLTLLFDVPVDVSQQRLVQTGNALDRFEREKADFFARVRETYLRRAGQFPDRIKVIDSGQSISSIHEELEKIILDHCFR
jgi:dTMP kinase